MAYQELLSHWKFLCFEILKLYRDFLTACQCQGTGADVEGNTQGQWIDMDIIAGEFRLYLGAKLLCCGSVVGISDL